MHCTFHKKNFKQFSNRIIDTFTPFIRSLSLVFSVVTIRLCFFTHVIIMIESNTLLSGDVPDKILRKRDKKGNAVRLRVKEAMNESIALLDEQIENSKVDIKEENDDSLDPALKLRAAKYSRGEGVNIKDSGIKNKVLKKKIFDKEEDIKYSEDLAGRTEVLLGETTGFIETEDGFSSRILTQGHIRKAVDITSASKQFDLALSFGPYRLDYTRNGRHLLLAGKRGHVAAFDWITKQLLCEMNVMESVFDAQWLHVETMFAVAQKEWLYVYNNQGVELHCIQDVHKPLRLEFLPYHFLLAASTESGWLKWLDVTMGKVVGGFNSYKGRMSVLTQNPYNAVVCSGHSNGTVAMWTPNHKKPVASMLCHKSSVQAITFDQAGCYMATSGSSKDLKLWDARNLQGPVQAYKLLGGSASDLDFSQTGLLAASSSNTLQIYKDSIKGVDDEPYLVHRTRSAIYNIQFSPYEDVLGLATGSGFYSMLVPGAGEANFDALEVNPMRSKSQRKETEVRSLLDKIPPEMISLDPSVLAEVDLPSLKEKWDAKRKILFARAPDINFVPRKKKKQGNSLRRDQVKKIIQQEAKKSFFNKVSSTKSRLLNDEVVSSTTKKTFNVLDRFKSKNKFNKSASKKKSSK